MTVDEVFKPYDNRRMWCNYALEAKYKKDENGNQVFDKNTKRPINPYPYNARERRKEARLHRSADPSGDKIWQFNRRDLAKASIGETAVFSRPKHGPDGPVLDAEGKQVFEEVSRAVIDGYGIKLGPVPEWEIDWRGKTCAGDENAPSAKVLAGIDIDNCIGPDGQMNQLAKDILERFPDTYAEVSISGKGIHLLMTVDPDTTIDWNKVKGEDLSPEYAGSDLEMYTCDRYFTLSENPVDGRVLPIAHKPAEFLAAHEHFTSDKVKAQREEIAANKSRLSELDYSSPEARAKREAADAAYRRQQVSRADFGSFDPENLTDEQVVAWMGSWRNGGSDLTSIAHGNFACTGGDASRACAMLVKGIAHANQFNPDIQSRAAQIDRIVRATGVEEAKWDRPLRSTTWGDYTIQKFLCDTPSRDAHCADDQTMGLLGAMARALGCEKPDYVAEYDRMQRKGQKREGGGKPGSRRRTGSLQSSAQNGPAKKQTREAPETAPHVQQSPAAKEGESGIAPPREQSRSGDLQESRAAADPGQLRRTAAARFAEGGADRYIALVAANPLMKTDNQILAFAQIQDGMTGPLNTPDRWQKEGREVTPDAAGVTVRLADPSDPLKTQEGKIYFESETTLADPEKTPAQAAGFRPEQILQALSETPQTPDDTLQAQKALISRIRTYVDRHPDFAAYTPPEKSATVNVSSQITARALGIPIEKARQPVLDGCSIPRIMKGASDIARQCTRTVTHAIQTGRPVQSRKAPAAQRGTVRTVSAKEPKHHTQAAMAR